MSTLFFVCGGEALVPSYSRFRKTQFSRAIRKETESLGVDSEKRSFQEQLRKTQFSRAGSEKRSFQEQLRKT
ncbi:MAG: hypothetical protein RSC35_03280, partial [Mucinivorans sp.]